MKSLLQLSDALGTGAASATHLLEACLERAQDASGEGGRVYLSLDLEGARAQAVAMDTLRAHGAEPSPWAGIPISVKDLFDVRGQVTRAGSILLAGAKAAEQDAPVIARLRRAGFVLIGRTNMTEFAFSGIGINPHYGTPRNPYDRALGRIPGGSSAGAAVSVTDGMAAAGIGTDTGGSCRIPAALCGITGYKPTARRIPLEGVYPLAASLDSVGPLAPTVSCCAVVDDILAGGPGVEPSPAAPGRLRLAVLTNYVTDSMDACVQQAFERALGRLRQAGVSLVEVSFPELEHLPVLNARGGIAAVESYAYHRAQLAQSGGSYDPRVGGRIQKGAQLTAADYLDLLAARAAMIEAFGQLMPGFDAVLAPTVPIVAPAIDAFATDAEYLRLNLLLLRNPSVFNFLDGCAISLPVHQPGEAPVGLMLAAPAGSDRRLFEVAMAVETLAGSKSF